MIENAYSWNVENLRNTWCSLIVKTIRVNISNNFYKKSHLFQRFFITSLTLIRHFLHIFSHLFGENDLFWGWTHPVDLFDISDNVQGPNIIILRKSSAIIELSQTYRLKRATRYEKRFKMTSSSLSGIFEKHLATRKYFLLFHPCLELSQAKTNVCFYKSNISLFCNLF